MIVILRRLLVRPYLPKRMQLMEVASFSGSKIDQLNEAIAATKLITDITLTANQKGKL